MENEFERWLLEELHTAYLDARKGKRRTADENSFEMNDIENLVRLRDEIITRKYKPSRGIAFIIRKPVIREIFAAPFRDRVVHHFLYNMVASWWDRRLIYDSYACRKEKGTLFGIRRLDRQIKQASNNYQKKTYVIKLDIQGYFMSLPRQKLYERICWGLDRQFEKGGPVYEVCKYLWKEIIFDDPTQGIRRKGDLSDWDDLPASKSLFVQPEGRGIVIGNLSSQLISNIYLDQLDRFVKFDLGYKYYGRYVDDFFILVEEERFAQAKRDINVIESFLSELGLRLHPQKKYIQDIEKGVEFLGVVIYPRRIVPGKRIKRNFRAAAFECVAGEREIDSVVSYLGHLKWCKSATLVQNIFENVGWWE